MSPRGYEGRVKHWRGLAKRWPRIATHQPRPVWSDRVVPNDAHRTCHEQKRIGEDFEFRAGSGRAEPLLSRAQRGQFSRAERVGPNAAGSWAPRRDEVFCNGSYVTG